MSETCGLFISFTLFCGFFLFFVNIFCYIFHFSDILGDSSLVVHNDFGRHIVLVVGIFLNFIIIRRDKLVPTLLGDRDSQILMAKTFNCLFFLVIIIF